MSKSTGTDHTGIGPVDWYNEFMILELAMYAGLLKFENAVDKNSIEEGINYYTDVYKNDPDRDTVKDSCSRDPVSQQTSPSTGGGGGGGYPFFRPFVVGGQIQFPLFGSICDPGSDCWREPAGDNDPE